MARGLGSGSVWVFLVVVREFSGCDVYIPQSTRELVALWHLSSLTKG